MKDRRFVSVAIAAVIALTAGLALAGDKPPNATLRLSEGSAAAGIGWTWGNGTLDYGGKTYNVKVSGLSVAEVGVTKAKAKGSVYNLSQIEDFDGTYVAAATEGTAVRGAGVSSLRNGKGVVINLKSETKGANIKVAAEGLKLTIEK